MHTFDLSIGEISKIEGKASLKVTIKDDKIEDLKFSISEFKRFYTQAVRGKDAMAIPQLTARICGTCSNAHMLCAISAVENALGVTPSNQTLLLRKLVNYGLNIRDHALHLYVFSLPDMLRIDSILELDENDSQQHQILDDTFQIKAAGNELGKAIGGRSVHAPYLTVGGFTFLPQQSSVASLIKQLEETRPAVLRCIELFKNCTFKLERDLEFVSLISGDYNFLDGEIKNSDGQTIAKEKYGDYLKHIIIPHSHASGYTWMDKVYMVGALARINLGKNNLHPKTQTDARTALSFFPSKNIYHNNLAQAIEILHALDSSLEILNNLKIVDEAPLKIQRKSGIGIGLIEAPRGTLYYRLALDDTGCAQTVQIVVPTGQNQIGIEKSIYEFLSPNVDKDKKYLISEIEKIVRAYDPCMSCASHFLKVSWKKVS